MVLAVTSYEDVAASNDTLSGLNLAWTCDEQQFLTQDVTGIVKDELSQELNQGLPYVQSYFLDDPFGQTALKPAAAHHLGLSPEDFQLTAGAGINTLLYALSRISKRGGGYMIGDVYPDLPHWLAQNGAQCRSRHSREMGNDDLENISRIKPALVHIERPNLMGELVSDAHLNALLDTADAVGALVIIDEAYGNYLPPSHSMARLVKDRDNLIVLRGISKGYWLGGVRLGYAIASSDATRILRDALVPMSVSSLSYRIGKRVLHCADLTLGLRQRIAAVKHDLSALLEGLDVPPGIGLESSLPYLVWPKEDCEDVYDYFYEKGVIGKKHFFWRGDNGDHISTCFRMSIPLAQPRVEVFRRLLQS
ncbi:MAG: aminotransferase class I/II-fold pyridoxal phosphate-dependent enzyme [Sulfitobacter sp.]